MNSVFLLEKRPALPMLSRGGLLLLSLLLTSCIGPEVPQPEGVTLKPTSFSALDGWGQDNQAEALGAFLKSCSAMAAKSATMGGQSFTWKEVCARAKQTAPTEESARAFFDSAFRPYDVQNAGSADGLFTGYYVPELRGDTQCAGLYKTPLYGHPTDKIDVNLGLFRGDLQGKSVTGKVEKGRLVPYDDRAAITRGSLSDRAPVLACVDDAADAFFLGVQGSGRVRLTDGSVLVLGYDSGNGLPYTPIGRVLADRGALQRPVTMGAIRDWLHAHPDEAESLMNTNPSYVFFRPMKKDAVLGSQSVPLTPERSLAVDPSFVPLGTPLWLETVDAEGKPFHRLMIAQDTGGAIKGSVRGDVFWGTGPRAEAQAGALQSQGHYTALLPIR